MRKIIWRLSSNSNPILFGLFWVGALIFGVNCARVWIFTTDDSYITFRYAANLAHGLGLSFNPGLGRVEGYTSFLWMLIMSVPHLLNFGVLSFAKLLGVLAMLGTMALMAVFLAHAGPLYQRSYRVAAAGLAVLFFALLPETAVHAVSGMETAAYTFLLTGLVTLTYLALQGKRRAANWLPLAALLTGLMRPEGNLVAVLMLTAALALQRQKRPFALRVAVLYLLPGLAYFLWRWSYFGVFLPLPFYVKSGAGGLVGWPAVRVYLVFLLANLGLYLGLGLLGERWAVRLILLAVLPDLAFFLFSYPIMGYDYRFVYPLLPLLLALAGLGLALLLEQAAAWTRGGYARLAPLWLGLLALGMFAGQNLPRTPAVLAHKLDYAAGMLHNHIAIGQALDQVPHAAQSPVLVVNDAGAMPYYSGWRTIDAGGLNEPEIALQKVQPERYIFGFHPDVLVLTSTNLQDYQNDSAYARALYHRALQDGLQVVIRSPFYQGDTIWVLARPGSAAAARLSARFAETQ